MKIVLNLLAVAAILALSAGSSLLVARGESLAAFGAPSAAAALGTPFGAPSAAAALGTPFDGRCIPAPPQRGCRVGDPGGGCVAPPSNTGGILSRRALPAGRLARLGATPDFHHGLLGRVATSDVVQSLKSAVGADLKVPTTLRFVPFVSLVFNRMPRQGVFMAVGGLGFLVQLAALAALMSLADWRWLRATLVSVELAVVHNFFSHAHCTWDNRTVAPSDRAPSHHALSHPGPSQIAPSHP